MLEGSSVYELEIDELRERLKAKGILLVVIEGNRNKRDVEWAAALTPLGMLRLTEVLDSVSLELKLDLARAMTIAKKKEIQ